MITIKLVRVGNMLVGQTVSDRWNLMQMGLAGGIAWDRNQAGIKKARRAWEGFTFQTVRSGGIITEKTPEETLAFTKPVPSIKVKVSIA